MVFRPPVLRFSEIDRRVLLSARPMWERYKVVSVVAA